ncbi:MAG: YdcF family protein [Proteobacteria bacterium]|nr:YdcF family protein [Pseudomonadota bacterium]
MDFFTFLKFLSNVVLPPASLAAGVVLGLVLAAFGWRRLGFWVAALVVAQTVLLSLPPVAAALNAPLEAQARRDTATSATCCYDAIVVLGGGVSPAAPPEVPDPDLTDAADRVWYAARLYHQGVAPRIIVSGGTLLDRPSDPAATEAEGMRRFLVDLGVPSSAIVSEGDSRNTRENVRNVRRLVGDARVALVTSAVHMPRALQLAREAGLNVTGLATDWTAPPQARPVWDTWMPTGGAMGSSAAALHEYMALLFDWRKGATR